MSEIAKLKEQLALAEKLEKEKRLQEELVKVSSEYKGKAFASHTFTRNTAALSMSAVYYEDFYIRKGKIYVLEKSIYSSKYNNVYKPSKTDISFSRHHYERSLTDDEHNAPYNLYSGYSFLRHEIPVELFEKLWAGVEECNVIVKQTFSKYTDEQEVISQGDHSNEQNIETSLKELNLDVIDFKNFPKVHRHIEYATLPLFQDRRWMPRIYAKQILEHHIEKLKKRQTDSWTTSRIYGALQYEIEVIKEFIKDELCQNKK